MKFIEEQKYRKIYWSVISAAALSCGGTVLGQTNAVPSTTMEATNVTQLQNVTVIGKLDQARNQILPTLGATAYMHTADQIQMQSQGDDAPLNQIVLRSPGVAQDSAVNGDLHVRGEHANLQYRINDVLLPEGITGFGLELDPRFIDSLQLITGSLPAEYGFRTAGIVDIKTKSGAFQNGGEGEVYGGSFDTIRPSGEFGGSSKDGKFSYFVDGSYEHNALGIENPTPSYDAIHDNTDQFKGFTYMSYLLSDTSRLSFMGSASYANFQVPNTPGLPAGAAPGGTAWNTGGSGLPANFNSSDLNEQQREQNYYGVVAYQLSQGDFNGQFSLFGRASGVHFRPDGVGDLYFNGVASDDERKLYSEGLQGDCSYELTDDNTIRGGGQFLNEAVFAQSQTTVFDLDPVTQNPTGAPFTIPEDDRLRGLFGGVYLQDEWTFFKQLTFNYGARFDVFNSSFDNEVQLSPRFNVIWKPTKTTTLHAGYSRYFTPPPIENVSGSTVALYNGTSNQALSPGPYNSVKAERSDYFDVGISQEVLPGLTLGLDGYYKYAHNQLDDGLFGQTLILSAFNYARGKVYGVEATGNYTHGGFNVYANVAWSVAQGEDWNSAQFLFSPSDLAYVQNHWIYLDHDQRVSGSFGVSYTLKEGEKFATSVYTDAIYGSGLRQDGGGTEDGTPTGDPIPNGGSVPAYYSVNLGVQESYKITKDKLLKARLDVVNLTDDIYQLRSGSGVGVNAAQYGERLGFFGSISFVF